MSRLSTIELFKEGMNFSAGHFTIFSATQRENLHGHNYRLYASFTTTVDEQGLSFDYRFYKEKCYALCQRLDETVLIPSLCRHLSISEKGHYYHLHFNDEDIIFLKRDVTLLPIHNVTVEELSHWFMQQMMADSHELDKNNIVSIHIKVFSGPGQSGSSSWERPESTA
jgi:6-pyruvoyltetrahydropterin/6-carboxytetrahydropterin synthase